MDNNTNRPLELLYFPIKQFSARFGNNFFTFDITGSNIMGDKCGQNYVVYNIQVFRGRESWHIERRFRDFADLCYKVRSNNKNIVSDLPKLPPKTFFRVLSTKFIDERKEKLNSFLHLLLHTISRHSMMLQPDNKSIISFLEIDIDHKNHDNVIITE